MTQTLMFDTVKADTLRQRAGLTYADLADAVGLRTRQAVGHWFRGRGEPNMQQLKRMAEAMQCHWLELVSDDVVVVQDQGEISRLERIRNLSESDQAELDAFIAFKAAQSGDDETP